jgi:hypothetical protein
MITKQSEWPAIPVHVLCRREGAKTKRRCRKKIISSNSAQKSHVKPQNHLNQTRSTTSTWHVYPHQSGTIKLASKTTKGRSFSFGIKTLPARLLKTNNLPVKSSPKPLGWKTLRNKWGLRRWFTRLSQIAHASTRHRHLGRSCYEDADNTASRFALTHVSNVCGLFPVSSSTTLVTLAKFSRPSYV